MTFEDAPTPSNEVVILLKMLCWVMVHAILVSKCSGHNVPNNIMVKTLNGQYVKLAKLAYDFSDPNDETQYFSVPLYQCPKNQRSNKSQIYMFGDRSFGVVCIY